MAVSPQSLPQKTGANVHVRVADAIAEHIANPVKTNWLQVRALRAVHVMKWVGIDGHGVGDGAALSS